MMANIPDLAGVATNDLVQSIGTGRYSADYINWSRTMQLLRTHAPGWLPAVVPDATGNLIHKAPCGAYMLIYFKHADGTATPPVPQSVMNNRNNSIPYEEVTSRDITDTHRRGICMAAAMAFGLAYELWAKMPLESGYSEPKPEPSPSPERKSEAPATRTDRQAIIKEIKRRWHKLATPPADSTREELAVVFGDWFKASTKHEFDSTVPQEALERAVISLDEWENSA